MKKITFYNQNEISDELLKFAVIAARYDGKWIFCRHKQRTSWEIPGGHRENGENILYTAKRELYEETGATDFEIKPVCVYKYDAYGLLCFAEVKTLGELPPEMEIGEIKLFDTMPDELTYPMIQPSLWHRVQYWLNLQSSPDELWDLYDGNRKPTGKTHRRGDFPASGEYHIVVDVWLKNKDGLILITKRSQNKGYPGMWECTGGSALAGEDSRTAALRELCEETGIQAKPEQGRLLMSEQRQDSFKDTWLFCCDFSLPDIVYQEGETCGARLAGKEEILKLRDEGKLVYIAHLDELLAMM